jgi:hypothetical protein
MRHQPKFNFKTWVLVTGCQELAPRVCLSPLREWKSKEWKLNSIHTTHKKVSPKMSIHKTIDQFQILFDEATQLLSIRIHELAFWMVSNHGCTCPIFLILIHITMAERKSIYSFKMNVPKNCKESKEYLRIFNTTGALAYPLVPMALRQRSCDWSAHCIQPI